MKANHSILFLISISFLVTSCETRPEKQSASAINFDNYKVADGFELQLVASEPLIEAPVAMDFDNQGRIWVVEMRGYMPNLAGTGEDVPNGRISILDDFDKDGVARHAKVFLDSLVLPRAIAHVYGGLLYAAPPNLWFVEINNDKPGKKILVDSLYSEGGYVELQPNGLMTNIDNWIYSANSNSRYRLKDGKWLKEPTSFRGQWGIAKDNSGRLYYNYNEIQLAGDYVLPNTLINNPYLKPKEGINKVLTDDQRVYPLHPTTVNRGYEKGILNKDSLLVKVTAACGPLIYRGDQFPENYQQNAFVCEPQANCIKRDILNFDSVKTTAAQAWSDREFVASTDEGFRPVNLLNAPDGSIYVVDMHRGVLEHRAVSTPYYRTNIGNKKLDTLLHMGRILRIRNKTKDLSKAPQPDKASGAELVELLTSANGWVRDRAQQLLVYQDQKSVIPRLQELVHAKNSVTAIHALHTLDALNGLSFDLLTEAAASTDAMQSAHALVLLAKYNSKEHVGAMSALANSLLARRDPVIDMYLCMSLGAWAKISPDTFLPVLATLSETYPQHAIYQEAVVSGLTGLEERFRQFINTKNNNKHADEQLSKLLAQTIKNKSEKSMNSIFMQASLPVEGRAAGLKLFRSTCAGCHGLDGDGIEHVGPPLKGSQYVQGSPDKLAMIILNGLQGPIHINGQLYTFNGTMPNFGNNFNDDQIADIIRYLRNSYVTTSRKSIDAERVKELRSRHSGTLTEKELLKMAD